MANKQPPKKNQFKKGQSGNPKGRPPILPELKEAIAKVLGQEKDGTTALDAVITMLFNRALKGDIRAAQELLDRGFGKPKQEIDQNIKTDRPIVFENVSKTHE